MTARQAEVVGLVARGHTNEQIAGALGISERGVRAQISRLFKRFGVRNRAGLIARVVMDAGFGLDEADRIPFGRVGAQAHIAIPPEQESRLYDLAPFMVAVMSMPDYRITYVNARFAETLGWRADHLIGKSYADLFSDVPPERIAARQRAARSGELKSVDRDLTRWKREDGSAGAGVLTYIVHPLWTVSGRIDGLLFIGIPHRAAERTPARAATTTSSRPKPGRSGRSLSARMMAILTARSRSLPAA